MAVKTPVDYVEGMYFITFTCQDWLPLFQITNSYVTVYKWFDYFRTTGYHVRGYVIMPNHLIMNEILFLNKLLGSSLTKYIISLLEAPPCPALLQAMGRDTA